MDATKTQIGGSHYKSMAVQPLEFGYLNQYDACAYSAIKYVSRHRAKDGIEGLKKAKHCIQFRLQMIAERGPVFCMERITMRDYVEANGFTGLEKAILMNIHHWSLPPGERRVIPEDENVARVICEQIDALIAEAYPQPTHEDDI